MTQSLPPTASCLKQMQHIKQSTSKLAVALPDVMKGFYTISKASSADGAINTKMKELIALAISVATRCDDCITFHTLGALKAGASRDEIMETLGVTVMMGGGPAVMYTTYAMEVMEQFDQNEN